MRGGGVDSISCPSPSVVVDVCDEQSAARQFCVPSSLLAVLEHIEFVAVAVVVYDVCAAALRQSLQSFHCHIAGAELGRGKPACHPLLVCRVACGAEGVAIVATAAHDVPCSHAVYAAIGTVVHVGVAETVGEFVADGADSCRMAAAVAVELVAACVLALLFSAV